MLTKCTSILLTIGSHTPNMAIASENYAENLTGSGTSVSVTLNASTNANRFVYCMLRSDVSLASATATYNGVSMTLLAAGVNGEWKAMFYLVGAASGSNTLTVNIGSSAGYLRVVSESFSGVGSVENTNSSFATTGTAANIAVTTVAANAWAIGGAGDNGAGACAAGTGTVAIGTGENALRLYQRNDNPQGTPGSKTLNFTSSSGGSAWGLFAVAIAPFVAPSGPANVKTFDGVTQSTGIKTYLGLAVASTKTVDGIA